MQRFVVAYDISDNRRRTRLAKVLDDFGSRVQESVFEVILAREQDLDILRARILREIEPREDLVRLYPFCAECAGKVTDLGLGGRPAFARPEVIIL